VKYLKYTFSLNLERKFLLLTTTIFYCSASSLNLLIVPLTVEAAVVLQLKIFSHFYLTVQAPPAKTLAHDLHFQIPTAVLRTASFPQKLHVYVACCVTSIFLTCLRNEAP
jgi:hypothetical protein